MDRPHFIYLFILWWTLSYFHPLATVNNAAINMGALPCLWWRNILVFFKSDLLRYNLHSFFLGTTVYKFWKHMQSYSNQDRAFFFNKFIYLFLAALGLCCCAQAFSSCGERGLLFVAVRGLLAAVASLAAEHRL